MLNPDYRSMAELEAGLHVVRQAPRQAGTLLLIVRRPADDEREPLKHGELHPSEGLLGDNWKQRGSKRTPDGSADPEAQITIMSARAIELVAQHRERWALAGDQLFVDIDLSEENLPPGTQLAIGSAVLEVSAKPHTGCRKFSDRFGVEALKLVSSPEGRRLRLRGLNARVVRAGRVQIGDPVRKLDGAGSGSN